LIFHQEQHFGTQIDQTSILIYVTKQNKQHLKTNLETMKNVDVEIYLNQLINFFENNPNDLMTLIGDLQKDDFYKKLRERCEKNLEEGKDIVLSKDQIVSVVVELKIPEITKQKKKYLDKVIQKTSFGDIILN